MTAYDDPRTVARPPVGTQPATGRQYVLRRGGAVARIGSVAAVLREFSVDGTRYTETWRHDAPPPMGAGIVLVPWPNRVADASWTWGGSRQDLDISDRARGHAIHGLARFTDYTEVECSADSVTLGTTIYPQHGWPFTLATSVTYALGPAPLVVRRDLHPAQLDPLSPRPDLHSAQPDPHAGGGGAVGLMVTHRVANIGPGRAVFGCGAHPYLRIGEVPVDQLALTVRAGRVRVTDDRLIPIGTGALDGALAALPTGARLETLTLDTGFTDLRPGDSGRYEHMLTAPDGRTLTMWTESDFGEVVVFTPEDFPDDPAYTGAHDATRGAPTEASGSAVSGLAGASRGARMSREPVVYGTSAVVGGVISGVHRAVAVEPMTCPTNALNSGEGLIELEPGETWSASWGLTPGRATP